DETLPEIEKRLQPILETLERACETEGRDPESLIRTYDLYSVVAPGLEAEHGMTQPVSGSSEQIADYILALGAMGFEEVRCDLWPKTVDAIGAMEPVIELMNQG
ncbi:MAG: hypothetical protein WA726_09890, partial [Acidimicrobiia bacterium]